MDSDPVFNRQKTRTVTKSLGTRILRFNRETKLTKKCKIIQIFTVRPKREAVAPSPLEYATKETILQVGIIQGRHFMDEINESI